MSVVVIGGGMGGLAAALRLARRGCDVELVEARADVGGLAARHVAGGDDFDAGPYILLDAPGLRWAMEQLAIPSDAIPLRRLEHPYEVTRDGATAVQVDASLEATCAGFDARWPGAGPKLARFIDRMDAARRRLEPMLRRSHPTPFAVIAAGGWRDLPLLLAPLRDVLRSSGLPEDAQQALAIWTHVAGQDLARAPGPMAFASALIHRPGAHLPEGGMRAIPRAFELAARAAGVRVRRGRVRAIEKQGARCVVRLDDGATLEPRVVVSGAGGMLTCLGLSDGTPPRWRRRFEEQPLQSPGACAYLRVRGVRPGAYLRFRLAENRPARLLVLPGIVLGTDSSAWQPARLITPIDPARMADGSPEAQSAHVEAMLREPWLREHVDAIDVLSTRRPLDWSEDYGLYRGAMNPVMTAKLMRRGRMPHRAPGMPGLYLCGSATHPGQWVSLCAISGILAADLALGDMA